MERTDEEGKEGGGKKGNKIFKQRRRFSVLGSDTSFISTRLNFQIF